MTLAIGDGANDVGMIKGCLSVSVCLSISVCACLSMHAGMHDVYQCLHACMGVCVCVYMYLCLCLCVHVCLYMHVCICACVCVCVSVCACMSHVYVYACVSACMHVCAHATQHTHTHTHTHTSWCLAVYVHTCHTSDHICMCVPYINYFSCLSIAAHIGVGISGQEGQQAVLASDFSFGQFR